MLLLYFSPVISMVIMMEVAVCTMHVTAVFGAYSEVGLSADSSGWCWCWCRATASGSSILRFLMSRTVSDMYISRKAGSGHVCCPMDSAKVKHKRAWCGCTCRILQDHSINTHLSSDSH
jgi:hypothetical protein